ncbi:MAG: ATP synthase F0 subunit B [Candidatus Saccharicenans sp.]
MLQIDLTFVVVFILIWVLVIILTRVFFKPLLEIRSKRKKILEDNERAYKQALKDYEDHLNRIETSLKEARQESELIKEKIVTEALNEKSRLVSEIQTEVRGQVAAAQEELSLQTEKLKAELDQKVEDLAKKLEEKVLH